jgi:hypothetical protein
MKIADSSGNIAAGALIQTNTLFYCIFMNFSYVLRDILRGRGLFHVTGLGKNLFERVCCPLLFQL